MTISYFSFYRLSLILICAVSVMLGSVSIVAGIPVFPGAEGFGVHTPAGRNGKIYRITTTASSGPGSLAECLKAGGARVCIFERSGTITLDEDIIIKNPYLTVAGQTAPPPGITIKGAGLRIATHDVLIQHIRIRHGERLLGNGRAGDSLGIYGKSHKSLNTSNVVIDHCSLSWAVDENMSIWSEGVHDVTISNCIISEGLYDSVHPSGKHSCGMLIGNDVKNISIHSNLFANNHNRNPTVAGNTSTVIVNNIIFNPQYSAIQIKDVNKDGEILSIIKNNYVIYGNNSIGKIPIVRIGNVDKARLYYEGNVINDKGNKKYYYVSENSNEQLVTDYPIKMPLTTVYSVDQLESKLLGNVGAMPKFRDAVDKRIIADVLSRRGAIVNCVGSSPALRGSGVDCSENAGGWPAEVHVERSVTLGDASSQSKDDDGDGYSNFEEWLHNMKILVEKGTFNMPEFLMLLNRKGD